MNLVKIFKALSNQRRLDILKWLEEPQMHFPTQQQHLPEEERFKGGVCVGDIQKKTQLSQSTISHYLSMMEAVNLLESKRLGQWTYYRRNQAAIEDIFRFIETEI